MTNAPSTLRAPGLLRSPCRPRVLVTLETSAEVTELEFGRV